MYGFKAAIILCVTLLIMMSAHVFYQPTPHNHTLIVHPNEKGVYIFDQTSEVLYHCERGKSCTVVSVNSEEGHHETETFHQNATEDHLDPSQKHAPLPNTRGHDPVASHPASLVEHPQDHPNDHPADSHRYVAAVDN